MLATVASVAQISSVIGALLVGLWGIWRKIDKHQSHSDQRAALLEQRLDSIQAQFGPNGGGLREAVNRISDAVSKIDTKLDTVTQDVAMLTGEFHQHIRESKND
jgi:hypothetical protein